jgi:hypothetical protein
MRGERGAIVPRGNHGFFPLPKTVARLNRIYTDSGYERAMEHVFGPFVGASPKRSSDFDSFDEMMKKEPHWSIAMHQVASVSQGVHSSKVRSTAAERQRRCRAKKKEHCDQR